MPNTYKRQPVSNARDFRWRASVILVIAALILACVFPAVADEQKPAGSPPNILFLAIDDLRPELGAYGNRAVKTPSIDRLASEGVLFRQAFANVPVCGASRASMLSGLRPSPNRFVTYYSRADKEAPGVPTLPAWLKRAGYTTVSLGKISHHSDDSLDAWSEPPWDPQNDSLPGYRKWRNYLVEENIREDMKKDGRPPAFEAPDVEDDAYFDGKVAVRAIEKLNQYSSSGEPFFLAVGFVKPHLPFNAPKRYWDMYPNTSLPRQVNQPFPENLPKQASHNWGELRSYGGVPESEGPVPDDLARQLLRGYRAATSYVDAQVGRVLDELQRLGLAENTIVVLWGDHGYSLGEHGLWAKHSLFELATRIPLIIRVPGGAEGGTAYGLVESVDIYPTLVDLVGLTKPTHLEGRSFVATVKDPVVGTKDAVYLRYQSGDHLRTDRYSYSEWRDKKKALTARMLFDHLNDPQELRNVVDDPAYSIVVSELAEKLQAHLDTQAQGL